MKTPTRISLEQAKTNPKLRAQLEAAPAVRIWSAQHWAFWRPNRSGHVVEVEGAGIYTGLDAFASTHHCGPEKQIFYEIVPAEERTEKHPAMAA